MKAFRFGVNSKCNDLAPLHNEKEAGGKDWTAKKKKKKQRVFVKENLQK